MTTGTKCPEKAWTTLPGKGYRCVPCSPHLYRDCNVLVKREARLKNPVVYEHEMLEFYVSRSLSRYATAKMKTIDTTYGVCKHCMRRAEREDPEWLR
jgi:hypothetical protein